MKKIAKKRTLFTRKDGRKKKKGSDSKEGRPSALIRNFFSSSTSLKNHSTRMATVSDSASACPLEEDMSERAFDRYFGHLFQYDGLIESYQNMMDTGARLRASHSPRALAAAYARWTK
jgi:hypothetical protein